MSQGDPKASTPAIELAGLTKRYRGGKVAVDGLSLAVPRGSIVGLIGPNGAGKSTTLRMLMGMTRITEGTARVLGVDPATDPAEVKRRVGYVPESHQIYRWMRVGESIAFARSFYPTWDDALCAQLVSRFGLDERARVKHLSKGTLAKLSLLLAVAHAPELLILDEPMSGLDPIAREEFLDGVVRTLAERECTVLFSSHTLADVQRLADRVAILDEGRLLACEDVDEMLSPTKRLRAVLAEGATPEHEPAGTIWRSVGPREWSLTVRAFSPELVERLRAENRVEAVDVIDLNLEDVFKDFVRGRRGQR
jgi:ABC-2 type transport system ATP-binding protein